MKTIRYILLLTLLTCTSVVWAQGAPNYWQDINFSTFEDFGGGEGTEDDPYVISTPEHLARLAYLVNNGTDPVANLMKGKYFVQRADIDLSALLWTPIGKDNVNTFLGNYDGMGHTISGMRIDDYYTTTWPVGEKLSAPGYGLFGSVNGIDTETKANNFTLQKPIIQNVVLVNPSITLDTRRCNKYTRMGLIVGALGNNATLQNCNVQGGSIVISNLAGQTSGANMFIGGAVGDCAPGFAGYSANSVGIHIQNISVEADITIRGTNAQGNYQYDAGGIVGRMRYSKGPLVNCYFTGKIDAPQFIVSPSYGAVRNNSSSSNISTVMAGQFYSGEQAGEEVYFGNYQVKYKDTFRTITGNPTSGYSFTPADGSTSRLTQGSAGGIKIWTFGTCPTAQNSTAMYGAQGVNSCDTYVSNVDDPIGGTSLIGKFNNNVAPDLHPLIYWVNHNGKPHLHRKDDAKMDSTKVETEQKLRIDFNDTEATDVHYHWSKTIDDEVTELSNDQATITIPEKSLVNCVWSAHVSYRIQGDTSGEVYHSNTVTYHQRKNVDTPPYLTVDGSITGNNLTLTASIDQQGLALEDIRYHWTRMNAEQPQTTASITTEAYTDTNIEWQVYATFTHYGDAFETEPVSYTQTMPQVAVSMTEHDEDLDITLSFETYDGALTDIIYCWDYNIYDAEKPDEIKETIHHESTETNTYQVSSVVFEEKIWHVYVRYKKGGVEHQTESVRYAQLAKELPTLSVTKDDSDEDHLVMQASLVPNYTTITTAAPYNLKYHWSKDGAEQSDHYDATRTVPHAFDTQFWRCWATFTIDGKDYKSNEEEYIYYSTLGQLDFAATANGNIATAKFKDGTTFDSGITIDYTWKTNTGASGEGTTFTSDGNTDWVEFTATITDGKGGHLVKTAFYRFVVERTVVYINYTGGGNDLNDGFTRETPVRTWKKAYSLLDPDKDIDHNIIVIVNTGDTRANMLITEEDTNNGIAATITGEWPWDGTFTGVTGRIYVSASSSINGGTRIGAPTKFKHVVFYGTGSGQNRFCCWMHDVCFDTDVVMQNFGLLEKASGALTGRRSPDFHLLLYADQLNNASFLQSETDSMTITIKSGQYGRILASRIAGTKAKETYIIGRHNNPVKAIVNIDIQDPDNKNKGLNAAGAATPYTDDIGYIAAGLTQGMMYGDIKMNITGGTIATFVAASQGNAINLGDLKTPVSTFCGRTIVNINAVGGDDKVVIQDYYGGCQGRVYGSDGVCDAYLYGKSCLNMTSGTIKANLFASSAGISGLRSADPNYYSKGWYTLDQRIPYPGSYAFGVDYLPYDPKKEIVTMTHGMGDTTIKLSETEIIVNISGGIVEGNVYGGSYGYSDPLDMIYAPAHAGRLFGNTSVNISGGTIMGSVYGGGAGSTGYYDKATTTEQRKKFTAVAQVYGNTHVNITGGNIIGNIYGGGGGVPSTGAVGTETEFLDIAKVYGNTYVTIDAPMSWEYRGTIYGGGALGGVEGTTSVNIISGTILGNVFGGSQGEEGHPEKAKVYGGTKVVVGE